MSGGVTAAVIAASSSDSSLLGPLVVAAIGIAVAVLALKIDSVQKWLNEKLEKQREKLKNRR